MKEFTLNADFGMTASDDEFSLYGIHTGDMIMFKKVDDLPPNGSIVAVSIDNGPATLKRISFYGDSSDCYFEGGSGKVAPIFISAAEHSRLKILGVAISVIHHLSHASSLEKLT
jgi:SOS-response transcriptional repressor LexA